VAIVLFKTLKWSLQQRVLFRNLTGFPFIEAMTIVSIPNSGTKVQKIIIMLYVALNKKGTFFYLFEFMIFKNKKNDLYF